MTTEPDSHSQAAEIARLRGHIEQTIERLQLSIDSCRVLHERGGAEVAASQSAGDKRVLILGLRYALGGAPVYGLEKPPVAATGQAIKE